MWPWSFHTHLPMPVGSAGALLVAAPCSEVMLHPQLLPPAPGQVSLGVQQQIGIWD